MVLAIGESAAVFVVDYIEPMLSHLFSIMRRFQQAIDQFGKGNFV